MPTKGRPLFDRAERAAGIMTLIMAGWAVAAAVVIGVFLGWLLFA